MVEVACGRRTCCDCAETLNPFICLCDTMCPMSEWARVMYARDGGHYIYASAVISLGLELRLVAELLTYSTNSN